MRKRILTGITTTGTPHIGNYLGAIKPALELVAPDNDSFFFLADYHALIKQTAPKEITHSVKNVALAWLYAGLDPEQSYFYRQSDIPEVQELAWILNCSASKGLLNRAHAYKAIVAENTHLGSDEDKGINMGLFSYPVLMAADILIFNATHVPVGPDQAQHMEMTRDIAGKFNHTYSNILTLPEALIQNEISVPGNDGRKMSKSYNNIIPFLSSEKALQKSIAKILTNSLEPGEPKETKDCNIFSIYKAIASEAEIADLEKRYQEGIGWGDAKNLLFETLDEFLTPFKVEYENIIKDKSYVESVLLEGANKAKEVSRPLIEEIRKSVGIKGF